MTGKEQKIPPYVSYESFKTLLSRLKDASPLPKPMDSSFWRRMKFSGSGTSALKTALLYLTLIQPDGTPTEALEALVSSEEQEQKAKLKEVFVMAYEPIITRIDLQRATSTQLRAEFSSLGVSGDTISKSISFFLAMARDTGQALHPHLSQRTPQKRSSTSIQKTARKKSSGQPASSAHHQESVLTLANLHPSLLGLLSTIPPVDKTWDKEAKEKFKTAFIAILEVLYP